MEQTDLKVTNERWYPQYHIAAPSGWVNDPNGFCYFGGQYHFFYQHYPYGAFWGPMHWGHVVSRDLVNWEHLPVALAPDKDYDKDGVFSGSGIEKDGKFYLMYTGHVSLPEGDPSGFNTIQKQCLAVSSDGVTFEKLENNPIIDTPKNIDMSGCDFRDPKVWKRGKKYYCVLGSKTADGAHGELLLYESKDLENWTFKSIPAKSVGNQGDMWECPNFARVDGQDVLIMSPMGIEPEGAKYLNNVDVIYTVGKLSYKTGAFTHGEFELLDWGFDFYAPQITQTTDGRVVFIGWLQMWNVPQPEQADGWAGQMTIPRELKIKNGKVYSVPIKELETLRRNKKTYSNTTLEKADKLAGVEGSVCELLLTVDALKSKKFSIDLRGTVKLFYDAEAGIFKLIRDAAGDEKLAGEREVKISPSANLKLRIYLDKSSVEVFINDGEAVLSARIYPAEDAQEIVFVPEDNLLSLKEVEFYKLAQSFPKPKM